MKKMWLLIPVILILVILLPWIIAPVSNDFSLHQFSKQLYDYPLPPHTQIVEKQQACGKLNGNGNGMDFLAAVLLKSDLPSDELSEYYAKAGFQHAKNKNPGSEDKVVSEIVKPASSALKSRYLENKEIIFEKLKNVSSYSDYSIVLLYDGGYSADFDIRGH